MNWERFLTCMVIVTSPIITYCTFMIFYTRNQRRHERAHRVHAPDLIARVHAETPQRHTTSDRDTAAGNDCALPTGWHWPTRDADQRP